MLEDEKELHKVAPLVLDLNEREVEEVVRPKKKKAYGQKEEVKYVIKRREKKEKPEEEEKLPKESNIKQNEKQNLHKPEGEITYRIKKAPEAKM